MPTLPSFAAVIAARDALLALKSDHHPWYTLAEDIFPDGRARRGQPSLIYVRDGGYVRCLPLYLDGSPLSLSWPAEGESRNEMDSIPSLAPHVATIREYMSSGGRLHAKDATQQKLYAAWLEARTGVPTPQPPPTPRKPRTKKPDLLAELPPLDDEPITI